MRMLGAKNTEKFHTGAAGHALISHHHRHGGLAKNIQNFLGTGRGKHLETVFQRGLENQPIIGFVIDVKDGAFHPELWVLSGPCANLLAGLSLN